MKWEYKTIEITTGIVFSTIDFGRFEEMLNNLGSQGWDLVSTTSIAGNFGRTSRIIATFKRSLP